MEWEGGSLPSHPAWEQEEEEPKQAGHPAPHPAWPQGGSVVETAAMPTLVSNSTIRIEIGNQVPYRSRISAQVPHALRVTEMAATPTLFSTTL